MVMHGITANQKHRYRCKACRRQFITNYTYRACQLAVRQLVLPMTIKASGIRAISPLLRISPNPVLSPIKTAASLVADPTLARKIENLELDEFWSLISKKANQRWTWYGFDRERQQVVAYVNGRRTDANGRALYEKVKKAKVERFQTDQWAA
jgi:insertion element IS1 protein InsB